VFPELLRLGDFAIPTYGVVYLIAFLSGIAVFAHLCRSKTMPFGKLFELGFQMAIAGEIGARLTFIVVEWERFSSGAIGMKQFLVAGRVVLGGIVAGLLFCIWAVRHYRLKPGRMLDGASTGAALGMSIGRLGCLAAGCCYGKPTDLWWGLKFTHPAAEKLNGTPLNIPLHPTQLLQFASALVLFAFLFHMHRWKKYDGQVTAMFFLVAGIFRFGNEFLRGDPRGEAAGIMTSQWIGLMMAAGAAAWLLVHSRRRRIESCG
jgi:phosphatidylglycerol:prolipoprotein diacylglycerol transferase